MGTSEGWQPGMAAPHATAGQDDTLAGGVLAGDVGPWAGVPAAPRVAGDVGSWAGVPAAPRRRHRIARLLALAALAGTAGLAGLAVLTAILLPHGGVLAIIIVLLAVPGLLLALATAAAVWIGRRAWRSGAWLEAVPLAVGMPWLSRVIWAARAILVGRAFWRLGQRARRPWLQPRAGGLSGTTR